MPEQGQEREREDFRTKDYVGVALFGVILSGFMYFSNAAFLVKWILSATVLLIGFLKYVSYASEKHRARLQKLETHITNSDIAVRDLREIDELLDQGAHRKIEAFQLLQEPYDGDDRLIDKIADDDRDISKKIMNKVIAARHDEDDEVVTEALITLSSVQIPKKQTARRIAHQLLERLQTVDEQRERRAYLQFLKINAISLSKKQLTKHRATIAAQFDSGDPIAATYATYLTGVIASYSTDAAEEIVPSVMKHINMLINADPDGEKSAATFRSLLRQSTQVLADMSDEGVSEPIIKEIPVILFCLKQEQPVSRYAARIAYNIAPDAGDAMDMIAKELENLLASDDETTQRYVVEALAYHDTTSFGQPEATIEQLVSLLETDDERQRAAIFLLKNTCEEYGTVIHEQIDHLDRVLAAEDHNTRYFGYQFLAKIAEKHPEHVKTHKDTLLKALDHDEKAGKEAIWPIYQYFFYYDKTIALEAGESLVPYLDSDKTKQKMAAQILSSAIRQEPDQYQSLRPVVEDLLDRDDAEVVRQACMALEAIGTEDSREKLKPLLEHPEHKVRVAATKAYKIIGDESMSHDEPDDETDESIHIEAGGTIEGDILINGEKTNIDEIDKSKDIKDSVMKDIDFD